MSSKGIFTAVSGAMAQDARLETIANNIANANTTGFKKDQQTFYEYLSANEKQPDVIQVPRIPASIESFYDMQGGDRGYVDSSGTFTKFEQGSLKPTGSTLDLALEGSGFFEVATPSGVKFTRNGSFKMNQNGELTTNDGHPVLREGAGQDPAQRAIKLNSSNVTISQTGEVYDGGVQVAKLSIVDVQRKEALQKVGSSFYQLKENYNEPVRPAFEAQVHQGFVEGSNVNVVQEMTDMIMASRVFESNQQAIKAFDKMDDKLVNQVGKG